MNKVSKKIAAMVLAPIAVIGMAFSLFTSSAIATGETQQGVSGEQDLASQATSISTEVRPWCGWTALTAANASITLAPATATVYDGTAIDLVATGQQFAIRVGPAGSAVAAGTEFTALGVDNCSWFADDQINGVAVSTELSGNSFIALSDANTGEVPTVDATMDFDAKPDNPLSIGNTAVLCDGFSFDVSPLLVTATGVASANVVSLLAGATGTNNFCSWTSDYAISIPGAMKPMFGDSTYTYTGPTITNTMVYSRP
jgi:hypothetical protein